MFQLAARRNISWDLILRNEEKEANLETWPVRSGGVGRETCEEITVIKIQDMSFEL